MNWYHFAWLNNFRSTRSYVMLFQCICFCLLYSVWALPETIALRNICLALGALASLYPIYQARSYLRQKSALPTWLIFSLFIWMTFHLLFLSQNPILQMEEFSSIWKRAFIGSIFGVGFGIQLSISEKLRYSENWHAKSYGSALSVCKAIMYFGMFMPTFIYLVKYIVNMHWQQWGAQIPNCLAAYIGPNSYYIAKTTYVCFCLPILAVALGLLYQNIKIQKWLSLTNLIYLFTIASVIFVFNAENIKNGFVYSVLLGLIFTALLFRLLLRNRSTKTLIFIGLFCTLGLAIVRGHVEKNDSWKTFVADAKVAWDIDQFPQWQTSGHDGFPNNELGKTVSVTNYERIAWGKAGILLLIQHPLGYGLVERSFGRLAEIEYPQSTQKFPGNEIASVA